MGVTVRKNEKDGFWYIHVHHNNQRMARKVSTEKKAATELAKRVRVRLAAGHFKFGPDSKSVLFSDYCDKWLKMIEQIREPATHGRYKGLIGQYIGPAFKHRTVQEIKRADLRSFYLKQIRAGQSSAQINLMNAVLSGVFKLARDDELIAGNPAEGVLGSLRIDRGDKLAVEPYNLAELSEVLAVVGRDYAEYYPFFLCACRTGARLGELIGLHWSDIDWRNNRIKVQRSVTKQGVVARTKNKRSRWIDLSPELKAELLRLQTERKKEALRAGSAELRPAIFHRGGRYWSRNSITYVWEKSVARAGLRREKFHAIRHTVAANLLSAGAPINYVKELLGHSSIKITIDIYGRFIPQGGSPAVGLLDVKKAENERATA